MKENVYVTAYPRSRINSPPMLESETPAEIISCEIGFAGDLLIQLQIGDAKGHHIEVRVSGYLLLNLVPEISESKIYHQWKHVPLSSIFHYGDCLKALQLLDEAGIKTVQRMLQKTHKDIATIVDHDVEFLRQLKAWLWKTNMRMLPDTE